MKQRNTEGPNELEYDSARERAAMPIFEFRCKKCRTKFEKLMFGSKASVACPSCGSSKVEKLPSTFGMSGVEHQTKSSSACAGCSSGSCSSCH